MNILSFVIGSKKRILVLDYYYILCLLFFLADNIACRNVQNVLRKPLIIAKMLIRERDCYVIAINHDKAACENLACDIVCNS